MRRIDCARRLGCREKGKERLRLRRDLTAKRGNRRRYVIELQISTKWVSAMPLAHDKHRLTPSYSSASLRKRYASSVSHSSIGQHRKRNGEQILMKVRSHLLAINIVLRLTVSLPSTAKLLFDLGLLRTPPVEEVLKIAASSSSAEKQQKALRYFLDGCVTMGYGSAYTPTKHDLAFVPAIEKGKEILAKPTEVFGNPEAALLGFPILSMKYAAEESRFRIARDPPSSKIVSALVASPPQDIASASKIFAYLSSQVSREPSSLSRSPTRKLIRVLSQTSPLPIWKLFNGARSYRFDIREAKSTSFLPSTCSSVPTRHFLPV